MVTAKGRRVGRPVVVDANNLAWAAHLRDAGHTVAEVVAKTGIPRTSLYRHLPPRPPMPVTAAGGMSEDRVYDSTHTGNSDAGTGDGDRR